MPPPDVNIGQVAASAWESVHVDGPTDNIMTSQALLFLLREGGYENYEEGGRLFEYPVEFAINPSFKSYGEMETLDTNRYDTFDAARYEQKIFAGTVVISELEKLRNALANRKFDVVKRKLKNGNNSAMEQLDAMLFQDGTGNGGKDMDGLAKLISSTPTTGTVGTINAGTWSFWRNRQTSGAKTSSAFDNLRAALESIHNQCSLGGTEKKPTGLVTDRASFEGYKTLLVNIERLVKDSNGSPDGDIGFMNDAIRYNGIPMVYDEQATAGVAYFVNKNFLKLTLLKGAWMKQLGPVEAYAQLSAIMKIMTVGNLTASARRHLGCVTAIT